MASVYRLPTAACPNSHAYIGNWIYRVSQTQMLTGEVCTPWTKANNFCSSTLRNSTKKFSSSRKFWKFQIFLKQTRNFFDQILKVVEQNLFALIQGIQGFPVNIWVWDTLYLWISTKLMSQEQDIWSFEEYNWKHRGNSEQALTIFYSIKFNRRSSNINCIMFFIYVLVSFILVLW